MILMYGIRRFCKQVSDRQRQISCVFALLFLIFGPAPWNIYSRAAAQSRLDRADLVNFMAGDYTIVGKKADSRATYSGRLTFHTRGDKLDFTRTIHGHTVRGTAVFDTVTGDRIPVLRLRFVMAGRAYEGTYQWSSDYDNYCRFTGYVYLSNGKTKSVGLEMLFPTAPMIRD